MTGAAQGPPVLVVVLLAVVGGLALAGGAAGEWVTTTETRTVGGVEVQEEDSVSGVEFAAAAIPVGFGAALGGVVLAVTRGRARRAAGGLLALAGVAGVAVVGRGIVSAAAEPGALGPAAGIATVGGIALVAAGMLGMRRPRAPVLDDRYAVEGDAGDDEWRIASTDREKSS